MAGGWQNKVSPCSPLSPFSIFSKGKFKLLGGDRQVETREKRETSEQLYCTNSHIQGRQGIHNVD